MPERSQRIQHLFDAAVEKGLEERRRFLHDSCRGDASLRREVEGLLALAGRAESFLESPAIEQAARLAAQAESSGEGLPPLGSRVSHYEIVERLRRGGMGIVCRAVDHRLQRDVAVKFLPPSMVADPTQRLRFGRGRLSAGPRGLPHRAGRPAAADLRAPRHGLDLSLVAGERGDVDGQLSSERFERAVATRLAGNGPAVAGAEPQRSSVAPSSPGGSGSSVSAASAASIASTVSESSGVKGE